MLKLRDGRLHIFLRPGCRNYSYRFFFHGKYITRSTKTGHLALAKSLGEHAYDEHRFRHFDPTTGNRTLTWHDAVTGALKSLGTDAARTSRLRDYTCKCGVLSQFFHTIPLPDIKTRTVEEYVQWRQSVYRPGGGAFHGRFGKPGVRPTNKTIARDFNALRLVLNYAMREGVIPTVPDFPSLSLVPTAKGWFEGKEMAHLIETARQWVKDATTTRQQDQRRYCLHYLMFLWRTGLRVDECLCVTYGDVKRDRDDPTQCFITVRGGKLAYRMKPTQVIGLEGVVKVLDLRRKACPTHTQDDRIFPDNPRALVEELLKKAQLLYDERGVKRTAKSLRHTFIMERLLAGVSAFTLAKNCRTSVKQIEVHYGSYLTAEMAKEELTRKRPRQQPQIEGDL